MSGLLRRIKRSRAADAGETPAEGQAAAPEGTPTTRPDGSTRPGESATADASARGEHAEAAAPVIAADPDVPAGVDPAAAATQPPKGRRGRLRRRLRYLRRARELMLRDLGGLLYEVHRTGGGDVSAHGHVIGAKVQRIANVDAEAEAIESALAAPRAESVVFQPGVGGTCDHCGELYGSSALFCSNCGVPTSPEARETAAPTAEPVREVPPMPKAPAKPEQEEPAAPPAGAPATASEAPTQTLPAAADEPMSGDSTEEDASAADESHRNPFGSRDNGRTEDRTPPGDPLALESRS
jgi:hypothetical protein